MKMLFLATMLAASPASPGTVYSVDELNKRTETGQYPDQDEITLQIIKEHDLTECMDIGSRLIGTFPTRFPVTLDSEGVDTYTLTIWMHDISLAVRCEGGKMNIIGAVYK